MTRHTVRFRLTLLYVGLFLASAAALLTITYFLVAQQLPPVQTTGSVGGGSSVTNSSARGGLFFEEGTVGGTTAAAPAGCPPPTTSGLVVNPPSPENMNRCVASLVREASAVRGNALNQLLIESGVALGIMAIASVGLGWLMAGRVLRPLRTITATARRISARSLDQRIAMRGPRDELRELGETFDALLERLEASFRAQRQFVANASHELRTPLARQRTVLEVALRDQRRSTGTLATACERALAASAQQEQLIAAMLTLARGERGLDRFEPFDLAAIAEEALLARQPEAASSRIAISARLDPALTLGDASLAERLVTNLIDNALRHNVPDGHIRIATGAAADGKTFLSVSNTGPVIPSEHLPRLFQPFQRLDQARTGGSGLGLGLAIVQAIAAAHEAEMDARPRQDGGLTVRLRFLRADQPAMLDTCAPLLSSSTGR